MADPSIALPDPRLLAQIEHEMWTEAGVLPPDVSAVVRGAPSNPDKFFAHALRQAREYSLRGGNMASLSIDLILAEWPLERILAQQLATYSRYALCSVTDLQKAGFEVLATGRPPHADVVLPSLSIVEAERLSDLFALHEARNPYKQRR